MAKLVALIEAEDRRGVGAATDPCRLVRQWFTPDGQLVVERDEWADGAARDELERERMRLAACMAAALGNTRESAKERIAPGHPYWSASYGDVCRTVDEQIRLREVLVTVERQVADLVSLADAAIEASHSVPQPAPDSPVTREASYRLGLTTIRDAAWALQHDLAKCGR